MGGCLTRRLGGLAAAGGGGAAPSWLPTDLPDLVAWYDPDQQTESDGNEVNTLIDRSGNGFDFAKSTDNGPVLQTNFINGHNALDVSDVVNRPMTHDNTLLASPTACSAFWAVKGNVDPSIGGADRAPIGGLTNTDPSHYYFDGNWYESFGTNSRRSVNPPTSWANWHCAGVTSASNDFNMWWNGTAIVTSGTNTVATGAGTRTFFHLFAGHIGDIILIDAVPSQEDREKIEGYLAHKYGFESDLPGGHPYLSSPP